MEDNELGFKVSWDMLPGLENESKDIMDSFINLMESNGLLCGGVGSRLFVTKDTGSCTKADQDLVRKWLFEQWLVYGKIIRTVVGPLE